MDISFFWLELYIDFVIFVLFHIIDFIHFWLRLKILSFFKFSFYLKSICSQKYWIIIILHKLIIIDYNFFQF